MTVTAQAIETNEKHLKEIETKLTPAVEKAAAGLKAGDKARAVGDVMGDSLTDAVAQIQAYKEAMAKQQPAGHDQPLIDVMNVREAFTHRRLQEDYVRAAEKFLGASSVAEQKGFPEAENGREEPEVRYFFPEVTPRSYF